MNPFENPLGEYWSREVLEGADKIRKSISQDIQEELGLYKLQQERIQAGDPLPIKWEKPKETPIPLLPISLKSKRRISREEMFAQITQIVAQRSTCLRSKVGAILVRDGRIVSMGYNGPVTGMPECEPIPEEVKSMSPAYFVGWTIEHPNACQGAGCSRSIHAETNAIAFAAKAGVSVDGCIMYCSMSPCINCAKLIVNSGIKKVVYLQEYRDTTGIQFLLESGIEVQHFEVEE